MLGAALDVGLGLALLGFGERARLPVAASVAGGCAIALTLALVQLDLKRMGSGVYRYADPDSIAEAEVLFHRDGKTATVQLHRVPAGALVLTTNGKPDASIMMTPGERPSPDEYTMVMLGAAPIAAHPEARTAAVIGFGAGLTTHTLLGASRLERVDTIEIEPAMVAASRGFGQRVARAYADPRSRIWIEDAKSFFSVRQERYDLIVSEPSTAWVSGVSSLFTEEFYRFVRRYLHDDGVFVQWIQLMESHPALVAAVVHAFSQAFPDFVIYTLSDFDILILGGDPTKLEIDPAALFANRNVAEQLDALGIRSGQDVVAMRLGSSRVLRPLFAHFSQSVNSDFFPLVDLYAVRARYLRHNAQALLYLNVAPLPVMEMLDGRQFGWPQTHPGGHEHLTRIRAANSALALRARLLGRAQGELLGPAASEEARAALLTLLWSDCEEPFDEPQWIRSRQRVAGLLAPYLRPSELEPVWQQIERSRCPAQWTPAARSWLGLIRAVSRRDPVDMAKVAGELLASDDVAVAAPAYLIGAAMLGHLAAGRPLEARRVWEGYGAERWAASEPPIHLRLLELLTRPAHQV